MYDDLARAQKPSALEWLVIHALIPSVLLTLVLQWPRAHISRATPTVCTCMCFLPDEPISERLLGGPLPDAFPVLITMPRASYPVIMRRLRIGGRVVLRMLVNERGRVDSTSILVLQATDAHFIQPSRQAVLAALFRPARFAGKAGAAWTMLAIDFNLNRR